MMNGLIIMMHILSKDEVVQDVKQVCELLVEDLKTGLKSQTVTQSEYGALITDIKNCKCITTII